ncbi:MAG: hypothetical protein FJ264_03950 [Planctomycetes bacterium]|nr:hypothetical protein [Planctomycetota bacterium]
MDNEKIMKNKKRVQRDRDDYCEKSSRLTTKNFFIIVCCIELLFILWKCVFDSTRNGQTFLITFFLLIFISLPPGLGITLHIFKNKSPYFLLSFGLCLGYGFVGGSWSIMLLVGCPLQPYLYIGVISVIAGLLLYRKQMELRSYLNRDIFKKDVEEFLSPLAVLLFAFIALSLQLINNYVPGDVDCQSDSFNTLMILKEGSYPFVKPYLDQTRLELISGHLFHTVIAVVTKLKNGILIKEFMAVSVITGAFFCMGVYYLARFVVKNEIILFLAGIFTLTRAYVSCFNDNPTENMAFYYGAMFIVFLMYAMEKKKVLYALFAGFSISFCALSHPEIFFYNILPFSFFFVTLLLSKDIHRKKDYGNLLVILSIILIMVLPYYLRIGGKILSVDTVMTNKLHDMCAPTVIGGLADCNGYIVPFFLFGGIILLLLKRKTINVYLWTYFFVVLFTIEYWRLFQIFSPSGFKLELIGQNRWYTYKSPLWYPDSFHTVWYGGVIVWPVIMGIVVNFFYKHFGKYCKISSIKKYFSIFFIIIAVSFVGYEIKKAIQYTQFVKVRDYEALEWIKNNTQCENTVIYAPFDKNNFCPDYVTSYWVPIISERKSILFRNYQMSSLFRFRNTNIREKVKALQTAAYSIGEPESYKIMKDNGITHIFISALLSYHFHDIYQNSPFVERVHYSFKKEEALEGTALVYKVK